MRTKTCRFCRPRRRKRASKIRIRNAGRMLVHLRNAGKVHDGAGYLRNIDILLRGRPEISEASSVASVQRLHPHVVRRKGDPSGKVIRQPAVQDGIGCLLHRLFPPCGGLLHRARRYVRLPGSAFDVTAGARDLIPCYPRQPLYRGAEQSRKGHRHRHRISERKGLLIPVLREALRPANGRPRHPPELVKQLRLPLLTQSLTPVPGHTRINHADRKSPLNNRIQPVCSA